MSAQGGNFVTMSVVVVVSETISLMAVVMYSTAIAARVAGLVRSFAIKSKW
jgi:hypothetical protein